MNGSTTVKQAPPSAEEKAYLASQQALAQKQLDLINSQQAFNQSYMDTIQPQFEQQAALNKQLMDQQQAQLNDPVAQEIQKRSNDLLLSQIQSQQDLAPLQKQLLEAQIKQATSGNEPTPEQIASIDAATQSAYQTGASDINAFAGEAANRLGQELAPGLGLRPTDTPIQDRAALIGREATRQIGNLTSNLAGVNANARLNYPLASQQLNAAISSSTGDLTQASQQFQAALTDAAAQNRLRLLSVGQQSTGLGLSSGTNLASASRSNPLDFKRGTTTTTSPGFIDYLGLLAGGAKTAGSLGWQPFA